MKRLWSATKLISKLLLWFLFSSIIASIFTSDINKTVGAAQNVFSYGIVLYFLYMIGVFHLLHWFGKWTIERVTVRLNTSFVAYRKLFAGRSKKEVHKDFSKSLVRQAQHLTVQAANSTVVAKLSPEDNRRLCVPEETRNQIGELESSNESLYNASSHRGISSSLIPHIGFVYLLKAGPFYKIGKSKDPEKRLKQIKLQLPYPIEVVHVVASSNMSYLETHWHRQFADKRTNGEWFLLTDEDITAFLSQ